MSISQPPAMAQGQRLRQLYDVSSVRPNDGDLLVYAGADGKWGPAPGNFDDRYAPLVHNHDDAYAALAHNHDAVYAPLVHTHDDLYSPLAHNHDGVYSPVGHDHSGVYAPASHTHTGVYAPVSHDHSNATTSADGFMSSGDKSKLNGIATGATKTTLSSATPETIFSVNPDSGASGTSSFAARADHEHPSPGTATSSRDGWMTQFDKSKLDGISSGATYTPLSNSNPQYMRIAFGGAAPGTSSFASRADHVHSSPGLASQFQDGWMSKEDKIKLDSL